jgi:cellulose synthase/poly-beta-1,6-N-acetylglucosamine synthase-like glycosyltransferase
MPWLSADLHVLSILALGGYLSMAVMLSVYGLHRLALLALYYRHAARAQPIGVDLLPEELPHVLVQLPIYNEKFVADRLIDAVAAMDWPRSHLQIQVLDDSTDRTTPILAAACARHRAHGLRIEHVRREGREGFKAGALAYGMSLPSGGAPLIALFDADFVPDPDFLRRTVPVLLADERTGMVQGRWGHLNRDESLITKLQAILLDGHFVIEHSARFRSSRFFNFNGTAGIWRRSAIEAGGGWQGDTLCEDLDLSYRAQMAGWRFIYMQHLEVPAELPGDIAAFKSQQHRWAKGSIQTARKLLPSLWRSSLPLAIKVEATFHLAGNLAYPMMGVLLVLLPLSLAARLQWDWTWGLLVDLPIFICATINLVLFYAAAERELRDGQWLRRLHLIPAVLALGASLTINNSRAVFQALRGHRSPFVRTPKAGTASSGQYAQLPSRQSWLELSAGLYYSFAVVFAAANSLWHAVPFLVLFSFGFLYLGLGSLPRPQGADEPAPIMPGLPTTAATTTAPQVAHMRAMAPTPEQATLPPVAAPSSSGKRRVTGY